MLAQIRVSHPPVSVGTWAFVILLTRSLANHSGVDTRNSEPFLLCALAIAESIPPACRVLRLPIDCACLHDDETEMRASRLAGIRQR